jgi:threonine synthase
MNDPILFKSTNRGVAPTGLRDALLTGQAADRGLFVPMRYPALSPADLSALAGRTYPEVAFDVLRRFTVGVLDDERLLDLCKDAYDFEVPIECVVGRRHLLRLDRGPTASFKDFAARMMARWMGVLMEQDGSELVILTATSGDTGSAVAHAYHGVPRVRVVVLFPIREVSNRQRKQMTTLGGNITTLAVNGQFDDCQALVKRAFADPDLAGVKLTSANSINIGRLLPQSVYYVYAYVRLCDAAARQPMVFAIPSGNFGDMMGAVIAKRMGLPIERIVIATNANDEVPRFLAEGIYRKIAPSRVAISNAMNVGHPSNLARLVDVYGGFMDETGEVREEPDLAGMRRDLYAVSISDEETRATIKRVYDQHNVMLEPHGAVGWAGLSQYLRDFDPADEPLSVAVETAHPAKFPEEIKTLIGIEPPLPPSMAGLEQRQENYEHIQAAYEPLRDLLLQRFRTID